MGERTLFKDPFQLVVCFFSPLHAFAPLREQRGRCLLTEGLANTKCLSQSQTTPRLYNVKWVASLAKKPTDPSVWRKKYIESEPEPVKIQVNDWKHRSCLTNQDLGEQGWFSPRMDHSCALVKGTSMSTEIRCTDKTYFLTGKFVPTFAVCFIALLWLLSFIVVDFSVLLFQNHHHHFQPHSYRFSSQLEHCNLKALLFILDKQKYVK